MKHLRHLLWLWLVAVLLAVPQSVKAEDYFDPKYTAVYFTVIPNGQGCVHIKVMHLDVGAKNYYIENPGAWVYMKVGNTRRNILMLYNDGNKESESANYSSVYIRAATPAENEGKDCGVVVLTNDLNVHELDRDGVHYKGNPVDNTGWVYHVKKPQGRVRCLAEFDWFYPPEFAGKEASFYINGKVAFGAELVNREMGGSPLTLTSKPDIYISDPIFMPTGENVGYYNLVVSNTSGEKLRLKSVMEQTGDGSENKDITKECKASNDGLSLLIPAVDHSRKVIVNAQTPYNTYRYIDLTPKEATLDAFHNPKDFKLTTSWGKKGSTVLKWTVPNADQKDALFTDVIIIERQLYDTSKPDSVDAWTVLDQVVMENGKSDYEYTDSTNGCYGNDKYNSVRYRLSRATVGKLKDYMCTSEMPNKRKEIFGGRFEPRGIDVVDGKVKLTWFPIGSENDGEKSFLPDGWKLRILRTSYYYKGGMEVSNMTELDISNDFIYKNANGLSEYIDEGFSSCTQYSYALVIYPNDPAGVMKRQEKPFEKDNQIVKVEPVTDDSKVGNFKASYDEFDNRIHVQWKLDMQRVDTLKVLKQVAGRWEEMEIDPLLNYYDDYDVEAGVEVKYRLRVSYECRDGVHTLTPNDVTGRRSATGKIAGFLTFQDGTGLPNVKVQLLRDDNGKEVLVETVTTSTTGAYIFPKVKYSDRPYIVRPETTVYPNLTPKQYPVYLNKQQTEFYNKNFISDDAFDVDGYVYFEKTTVPVYGASFKVDGQDVVDKSGNLVISDNDGHFSFKVKKGSKRLTVEKEGHTFMYGGLYADNNGVARPINQNQTNVFFWDQTKVHTIGRVVGGLDQGDQPLGFGLSKNNLGDDLRIVLELEGNQRSWLVKDQMNDALTVVQETLTFEASEGKNTNSVTTERHRVVISPNAETGEYQANLLPVRYKVVEVSANGYPSLFQKGKVGEVLDLSDSLTTKTITNEGKKVNYNAIYSRVYRIEPSVTITELDVEAGTELPYVGDVSYVEPAAAGNASITVPLYDEKTKTYTFGYPVLRTGKHNFRVKATENYYYNGNRNGACDSVPLRGGLVRVYDDFAAVQNDTLCVLSKHTGSVDFMVDVQNTVYDVQGTNALRHLDVTLEHEGQFIDGQNLKAFVMGYQKLTDDILSSDGLIEVVDVLRDPAGSKSYSWLDKETTYHADFNFAIGASLALKLGVTSSSGTDLMSGAFAGSGTGTWMGTQTSAETNWSISPKSIPIVGFEWTHKGSVDFQLNERIQTSDDPAYVGADADVYCGYELVAATSAVRNVRAINEATYLYLKEANLFADEDGVCHLIAEGKTEAGIPYYLISDYNYQVGPKIKSNFAYTQKYILETLIPKLKSMRNSYIYKGTRAQAQAKANATLSNVFFSLLPEDDPRYGQDNLDESMEYISIDRYDELGDRLNYEVITPEYVKLLGLEKQMAERVSATDSIRIMNRKIAQWEYVVARNEWEKVQAFAAIDKITGNRGDMDYNPGTPYDVDSKADFYLDNHSISGGTMINHNETFDTSDVKDTKIPVFGFDVTNLNDEEGMKLFNNVVKGGLSIIADGVNDNIKGGPTFKDDTNVSVSWKKLNPTTNAREDTTATFSSKQLSKLDQLQKVLNQLKGGTDISVKTGGTVVKMSIQPDLGLTYDSNNSSSTTTKTYRGYQLETDGDSHLSIDVYHDVQTVAAGVNVAGQTSTTRKLSQGNYLFRTVGGATKCPYEGEEVTKVYAPGTRLSAATAHVEKPRITVEKHVVSGVPYGETAKFNLVLSNEGTVRQEGSFDLVLLDNTNQTGASLMMDGAPLGNGRALVVPFGSGMVKVLEMGQGMVDDYENIRLALRSQCDPSVADTVSLSVHFVPKASPIAVVTPQDRWVMNTNSAQDERGRYYMPVTIGGYDVNFRNFDHVELQYKQSSEPESRWTNLCSYYSEDSLFQKGAGTKAMLTGSTQTHAFYGDSDPVELKYDLRAVTYSRLGNDFVTNASPVFSGIKDTRRPQIFGSPQPANGILGVGDDLKLVFSEDINANKLLATNNFKVTGLPNNSVIGTSTYLLLPGGSDSYLETEKEYNPSNDSFTIDMMVRLDASCKNCTLFEQNYNGNSGTGVSIEINFINDVPYLLVQVKDISSQQTTSAKLVDIYSNFQRIIVVYDHELKKVSIYQNNNLLKSQELYKLVTGVKRNGKMRFGRYFKGNMLETRVWSKALTQDEIEKTAGKTLYGNEVDLVAYYPMNEGYGNRLEDNARDYHLTVQKATWVTPEGTSLRLSGETYECALNRAMFERTSEEKSYTLALWFNAKSKKNFPIMASGYGLKDETYANEKLFIGVKNEKLTISCDTTSIIMNKSYADNEWHQLTFVVDRSANVASAYVDGELAGQAQAVGFGKLYGAAPFYLGRLVTSNQLETLSPMEGYIDEITLWDMALPRNVVKQRMNESRQGTEPGLLAYVPFGEHVKQNTGSGTMLEFSTKYFFNKWDTELKKVVKESGDTFSESTKVTTTMKSAVSGAPVKEMGAVRDLRFDFVTKDNEMIIDLKELPKDIDRTTVNITAMGIEDMNGNEMAQPVTWSAFIDRNSVRWSESQKQIDINAEINEDRAFTIDISNHGGARRDYIIESVPSWMTVEEGLMGVLEPEETRTLHITISKDINIGTYDEVLYLTNDEALVNPLALTIKKSSAAPDWTFNKNAQSSMQLIAEVKMGDAVVTNKESLLAAFDEYDKCLGTTHVTTGYNEKSLFYLTIFGEKKNAKISFRLWDATSGITYGVAADRDIAYIADSVVASYDNPVMMTANSNLLRSLELTPTWTWVSLNVASPLVGDINQFLKRGSWQDGDQLKDPEDQSYYNYYRGVWNNSGKAGTLRTDRMYYIKSQKAQTINVEGTVLTDEKDRTITLHPKWNYIGYTPMVNLPVNEALEDLKEKASDGDIIKSQDEFATFAASVGGWRGNLQYMKPGKGYMLYHAVTKEHPETEVKFVYPFKGTAAVAVAGAKERVTVIDDEEPLWMNTRISTMNLIVRTEGIAAEEGDRLYAYADGELCGIAEAMDVDGEQTFFLSVGGEEKKALTFTLERDGEFLGAATRAGIVYQADTLEGTTDMPKIIDFSETATYEMGIWYTLTGIRLGENKPATPGVYIFNGQRVTVR